MESAALGERLKRLEDVQALHALKAAYAAAADAKYTHHYQRSPDFEAAADRQAACFTTDAVWDGGPFGGTIAGRAALGAFFRNSPWRFTAHLYSAPRFTIEGDEAAAVWQLWELGVRDADNGVVLVVGTTDEAYRRTTEGWKISAMRFKVLHSTELGGRADVLRRLIPAGEAP
jgi:hypothetical protein